MDWIVADLKEHAPHIMDADNNDYNDEDDLSTPNFDRFLGQPTKDQQLSVNITRPQHHQPSLDSTINKVQNFGHPKTTGGMQQQSFNAHHQHGLPDMQRFLNQPIQASNNNFPQSSKQQLLEHHSQQMKPADANNNDTTELVDKSSLMRGESSTSAISQHQQQQSQAPPSRSDSLATTSTRTSSPGDITAFGDTSGSTTTTSNNTSAGYQQYHPKPNKSNTSTARQQKNDKAVEVYNKSTIIARFRTQTECARYLRATPEAVSYHCSKGGGVCNGLVIKPLNAAQQLQGQNAQLHAGYDTPYFGLFEGSTQCRPSQRPQLKPETVAILKEWLLSPDHMDNPYPNQIESQMLMKKTGLDKTQLKHWFNNARKRILKPLLKNGGRTSEGLMNEGVLVSSSSSSKKKKQQKKKRGSSLTSSDGVGAPPLVDTSKKKSKKRRSDPGELSLSRIDESGMLSASSSRETNKMSNLSHPQHPQQRAMDEYFAFQHQGQDIGPSEDPFRRGNTDGGHPYLRGNSDGSQHQQQGGGGMTMMSNQQYADRLMGYSNANTSSAQQGSMMMGGGNSGGYGNNDSMTNMMNMSSSRNHPMDGGGYRYPQAPDMYSNDPRSLGNSSSMKQHHQGGTGPYQACMETNDSKSFLNSYMDQHRHQQGGHHQDIQPLPLNTGQQHQVSTGGASGGGGGSSAPSSGGRGGDETNRSNAIFKQQVATMAMSEASTAFREMEDAFARAKEVLDQCQNEDDPRVLEANAYAKKCQSVAMFKLKVSQRASEEAAAAYDSFQGLNGGGGGGPSAMGGASNHF